MVIYPNVLWIFAESVLCGPVHSENAVKLFETTLEDVNASGGKLTVGGNVGDIFKLNFFEKLYHFFRPGNVLLLPKENIL